MPLDTIYKSAQEKLGRASLRFFNKRGIYLPARGGSLSLLLHFKSVSCIIQSTLLSLQPPLHLALFIFFFQASLPFYWRARSSSFLDMSGSNFGDSMGWSSSGRSPGSRKGKRGGGSSGSDKPKQPQRGLGVAQLEKIRLQSEMAEYFHPLGQPPSLIHRTGSLSLVSDVLLFCTLQMHTYASILSV